MIKARESRSAKWYWLLVLPVAVAALFVWRSMKPSDVGVQAAAVSIGEVEDSVSTIGTVLPVEEFEARSGFSATVGAIAVTLGQHVQAGQLLVSMNDPFAAARIASAAARLQAVEVSRENVQQNGSQEDRINFASDLDHAQAERGGAQGSLDTIEHLAATGDASPAEVAAAKGRLHAADDALKILSDRMTKRYSAADQRSWDARVAEARTAFDAEKANLANVHITSPIAGVIYRIPVARYDFVPSGADLVDVANLDNMKILANFDEPDIGKLHAGQAVNIRWDGKPGHVWHGRIRYAPLSVAAQGQRNVGECSISIEDTHEDLPAHTTVTVNVLLERRTNVLTLPHEAVQQDAAGFFVYRIVRDELVRSPVSVGLISIARIEITRGLAAGDRVALHATGDGELRNHLKVRMVE